MKGASDRPKIFQSIPSLPCIRCIPWFKTLNTVLLCALWAVISIQANAAESISVLLQKGIYAEETEGDLDAAIKIYKEIVTEVEANRTLVAQAQYRLGMCQVKKGDGSAAAEAFRRILERFPEQLELVSRTRAELSALGRPVSATVVRQVWSPAIDTEGSVTADGKLLSFVDWDTGDVAIRNLETGENRRLTNKGSWTDSSEMAMYPIISRDGTHVVYCWLNKEELYDLRVVSVTNPEVRVVSKESHFWCNPEDWSPDGKRFVAQIQDEETLFIRLSIVSLEKDDERELKSFGLLPPSTVRFSPNGDFLVYSRRPNIETPENDIYLLEIATGMEQPLIQHPSNDDVLGWSPDGKALLFASDRGGSIDLWSAPIKGGKVLGEPAMLRPHLGDVDPIGILSDGRFFYGVKKGGTSINRAKIDFESGKVIEVPERIRLRTPPYFSFFAVSPDGRKLVYRTRKRNRSMMSLVDIETFQEKDLFGMWQYQYNIAPHWSDDGHTIMFRGQRRDGTAEFILLDTDSGAKTLLSSDKGGPYVDWNGESANGDQLLYVRWDAASSAFFSVQRNSKSGAEIEKLLKQETDPSASYAFNVNAMHGTIDLTRIPKNRSEDDPATMERFEIDTGKTKRLLSLPYKFDTRVFPNNPNQVAVLTTDDNRVTTVRVMDIENGKGDELFSVQLPVSAMVTGWGPKGKHLIYIKNRVGIGVGKENELWGLSVETGELQKTDLAMPRMFMPVVYHERSNQLFITNVEPGLSEVWVMENFLPTAVTTAK